MIEVCTASRHRMSTFLAIAAVVVAWGAAGCAGGQTGVEAPTPPPAVSPTVPPADTDVASPRPTWTPGPAPTSSPVAGACPGSPMTVDQLLTADGACFGGRDVGVTGWLAEPWGVGGYLAGVEPAWLGEPMTDVVLWERPRDSAACQADGACDFAFLHFPPGADPWTLPLDRWVRLTGHLDDPSRGDVSVERDERPEDAGAGGRALSRCVRRHRDRGRSRPLLLERPGPRRQHPCRADHDLTRT